MKKESKTKKQPKVTKQPKVKQPKAEQPKVQGVEYWQNRPLNDEDRDWDYKGEDWIGDYWISRQHPHRQLILDTLKSLPPFKSVLELGCNCGPNLKLVRDYFPEARVAGIDINKDAIDRADILVPEPKELKVGNFKTLPWDSRSFDVVLSDAALIYSNSAEIHEVMSEIDRVAIQSVVLLERFGSDAGGEVKNHIWNRDYEVLLEAHGFNVKVVKLPKELWETSKNWQKYGRLFVGTR